MSFVITKATDGSTGSGRGTRPAYQDSRIASLIIGTERYKELNRKQSYYDCTQHDHKSFDFDGRPISVGGVKSSSPMVALEKMPGIVPLRLRRPSAPYRLSKAIIDAYTNIVFGEDRFPEVRVPGDTECQDWNQALSKVTGMPVKMIQARNLGGACGSVGLSWAIIDGDPVVRVHNTKFVRVVEWKNRDKFIPLVVEEVKLFYRDEPDPEKDNRITRKWFWWRRTWNPDQDIVYQEIEAKTGQDPVWVIDNERTDNHHDGSCRFTWVQNRPSEEEDDGVSDLEGVWEQCDELDVLYSVLSKGGIKNLDPTLVLKMDAAQIKVMGLRKGSDQALITGKDGDASYLEVAGTSIDAGIKLFESMRRSTLETAQCVIPDPADIASQGVSSVSIKALYSPMLANASILRENYSAGMKRVLDGITNVSRKRMSATVIVNNITTNEDGTQTTTQAPGKFVVNLPPRAEEQPAIDEGGMPTGEVETKMVPRSPGEGGGVEFTWPPWFSPTPDDLAKMSTTLTAATGGKAYLSKQTATETLARALGTDPAGEWERVQNQGAQEQQQQAQMFQDAGGPVDPNDPNADPNKPPPPGGQVDPNAPPKGPPHGLPPPAAQAPPKPGFGGKPGFGKPNPFAGK